MMQEPCLFEMLGQLREDKGRPSHAIVNGHISCFEPPSPAGEISPSAGETLAGSSARYFSRHLSPIGVGPKDFSNSPLPLINCSKTLNRPRICIRLSVSAQNTDSSSGNFQSPNRRTEREVRTSIDPSTPIVAGWRSPMVADRMIGALFCAKSSSSCLPCATAVALRKRARETWKFGIVAERKEMFKARKTSVTIG